MMIRHSLLRSGLDLRGKLSLLAGMALCLPACGDGFGDHPPVYPVKGKVTVNGKPMNGGTIIFEYDGDRADALKGPPGQPFRVTAKISNEGTFNLVAYTGSQGMPEGKYKVGILTVQGRSESNLFDRKLVVEKKTRSAVASNQYADPKTSGLTAQVTKDGPNEPAFDLK